MRKLISLATILLTLLQHGALLGVEADDIGYAIEAALAVEFVWALREHCFRVLWFNGWAVDQTI